MTGSLIDAFGPASFFGVLGVIHAALGVFVIYRIRFAPGVPLEEQGPSVYLARTSSVAAAAAFRLDDEEDEPPD